jgi:hypothetical protein
MDSLCLVPPHGHGHGHGRLPFGLVATPAYIGVDHRRLIAPVNLSILGFSSVCNLGVLLIEPRLDGLGTLLIGAFDGLLWGVAPAPQVLAHGAHGQLNIKRLLDQRQHRWACPQSKVHLELLRAVLANQALDVQLLLGM